MDGLCKLSAPELVIIQFGPTGPCCDLWEEILPDWEEVTGMDVWFG